MKRKTKILACVALLAGGFAFVCFAFWLGYARQSQMAANETRAIGALKAYGGAQAIFRRRTGVYAADLTKLRSEGQLIDADMALAKKGAPNAKPYHGYWFVDLPVVRPKNEYRLAAVPAEYGITGSLSFYTDDSGSIFQKDLGGGTLNLALAAQTASGVVEPPVAGIQVAKEDQNALADGNRRFALELYSQLRDQPGNLCVSPYSVSTALAMLRAGARGNSGKQLDSGMHFSLPPERLHRAFQASLYELTGGGQKIGYRLDIANALWCKTGYSIYPEFLKIAETHYGATVSSIDFTRSDAASRINKWFSEKTNGRIRNMVSQRMFSEMTRVVGANAIYFKGQWASKFSKHETTSLPFHVSATRQVAVPTMHQEEGFAYFSDENIQVLRMNYLGDQASMMLVLPKAVDGLQAVEESLSAKQLDTWLSNAKTEKLEVYLPKFTFESSFNLDQTLRALGITDLFSSNSADLTGISNERGLFLQTVLHRAGIEVDEEGTIAWGGTAWVVTGNGHETSIFRADHPFLFLIFHNPSKTVLFMGRVLNPAEQVMRHRLNG